MKHLPDFRSPTFLRAHLQQTLERAADRTPDPGDRPSMPRHGDGSGVDTPVLHLADSTRRVITFANAALAFPQHPRASAWRDAARRALDFVEQAHRNPAGGYAWTLRWADGRRDVLDAAQHADGLAWVLLAQAQALRAGIESARGGIADTMATMERLFWEPEARLYADQAAADGQRLPYRGQKANMQACEALLAAFEATGDPACLERAAAVAESVTQRLASQAHGLIWEHYHADWSADWGLQQPAADPSRRWGFQTGHQTEWARLLLWLERLTPGLVDAEPESWMLHRARELFGVAVHEAWDRHHGGLVRAFAPHGHPGTDRHQHVCDASKLHGVQAQSLAAAAVLAERTHEGGYWDWYDRLWAYVWTHFVDPAQADGGVDGAAPGRTADARPGVETVDGRNLGACLDLLAALQR